MKISLDWLTEFVDIQNIEHKDLINTLSLKCFEVESLAPTQVEIQAPVVAGKILNIEKHPDADKLQITTIQIKPDSQETLQIVCGANNIQVNQVVPVALIGSSVINYKTNEPLIIKKGKIRGIQSHGMLCSAGELGLTSNESGIYILDSTQFNIGDNLIDKLNLQTDYILDIESRSNREDALCVQGYAREIASAFNTSIKKDCYTDDLADFYKLLKDIPSNINIAIDNTEECLGARFFVLENIKVQPSPEFIQTRLNNSGIKSINNIVDILNYIMLEIGQPMHAYDLDKFNINKGIGISNNINNQFDNTFQGLDENKYTVDSEKNLLIHNNQTIGSLAGVLGGLDSSITDTTTNILLEIACFNQATIRKSSRIAGVSTEASRRYERGTNIQLLDIAGKYALELLTKYNTQAKITQHGHNIQEIPKLNQITIDLSEYTDTIGMSISKDRSIEILKQLGIQVQESSANNRTLDLTIPIYRQRDLIRPIDIVEELLRFEGFDNIPLQPLRMLENIQSSPDYLAPIRNTLIQQGYSEFISSSLTNAENINICQNPNIQNPVKMLNPLSKEYSYLRTSLLPNILQAVNYNQTNNQKNIKLFEIGKVYGYTESPTEEKQTNAQEIISLAIVHSSPSNNTQQTWQGHNILEDNFYTLKSALEQLAINKGQLNIQPNNQQSQESNNILHPNIIGTVLLNNRNIGYIAKIHPNTAKQYNISENTYISIIELQGILKSPKSTKFKKIFNNQTITKHLTFDCPLDSTLSYQEIKKNIQNNKIQELYDIQLLTIFNNNELQQKAMTFELYFNSHQDENLTNKYISSQLRNITDNLQKQYTDITFRDEVR